jgi:hypothetical protein
MDGLVYRLAKVAVDAVNNQIGPDVVDAEVDDGNLHRVNVRGVVDFPAMISAILKAREDES